MVHRNPVYSNQYWTSQNTTVVIDFTAETKSSCSHEMEEWTIPHLRRCHYLSHKVEMLPGEELKC